MKQAKGEFTPKGSEHILRKVLGMKEPFGRARTIGNHVPHKRAFPRTKEEEEEAKRRRKEKKDANLRERWRKEFKPEFEEMLAKALAEERAKNDKRYLVDQGATASPLALPSPIAHKSSCASAVVCCNDASLRNLDGITRWTSCNLLVRTEDGSIAVAARGMVFPFADGDTVHGVPLQSGFMKCQVDNVVPQFEVQPFIM